ncbi:hypothetical protein HYW99_01225 [Candidatus Woesearchaeota archaeon]|nr:hypothetical protein [Candidatus Woesearchaeota archaeon]
MSRVIKLSMVSILVLLITALIFFKFQGGLREVYAETLEKQTCKTNVYAHALSKFRYADFSGEINCPTVELKIDDKNEEKSKKILADAMFDCWDQFGKGELDLFSDDSIYCTICHRITFDTNIKINGFMEYLANEKPPRQKMSYLQFLTTERTQNSAFLKEFENRRIEDTIDTSKNNEYAIIFTYIKGKRYLDEYLEKAKATTPGIGMVAIGFGIFKAGGIIGGAVSTIATPLGGAIVGGIISSAGGVVMTVGALWTGLTLYFSGVPFEHIALISFIPYDAENIKSLKCIEINIRQKG